MSDPITGFASNISTADTVAGLSLHRGWNRASDGAWYWSDEGSTVRTGWLSLAVSDGSEAWYWLDPANDGALVANRPFSVAGKTYIARESGRVYQNTWALYDGKWYLTAAGGSVRTGWAHVDGYWYWLDPENGGELVAGRMFAVNGKRYVASSSGRVYQNAWVYIDNGWYHTSSSGYVQTGWLEDKGEWYWLDPDMGGKMASGAMIEVGGKYYIAGASGKIAVNTWVKFDGNWYMTALGGSLRTGWYKENGTWYWFDSAQKGAMVRGVRLIDGVAYRFNSSGAYVGRAITSAGWNKIGNDWYYSNDAKNPASGWVESSGEWYYLDSSESCRMKSNEAFYATDGNAYVADETGACRANAWVNIKSGWYFTAGDCSARTGWVDYEGDYYYLDPSSLGKMVTGFVSIGKQQYAYTQSGALRTSAWVTCPDGVMRHAGLNGAINGALKGGKVTLDDGTSPRGLISLGDAILYVNDDGSYKTGWHKHGGDWLYFNEDGSAHIGSKTINGVSYYFKTDGVMAESAELSKTANASQMGIVKAAKAQPATPGGYCAAWVTYVYLRGTGHVYNGNADEMYYDWCKYSDISQLKTGMVVAVPSHPHTTAGKRYGHVGIYIGDGFIMHSAGAVKIDNIYDWMEYYGATHTPKWGWAGNVPLT